MAIFLILSSACKAAALVVVIDSFFALLNIPDKVSYIFSAWLKAFSLS